MFTVITPYVFEEEIKELKSNIPWELDWILEQDNSRIGPDMMYQRLWKHLRGSCGDSYAY